MEDCIICSKQNCCSIHAYEEIRQVELNAPYPQSPLTPESLKWKLKILVAYAKLRDSENG